MHQMSQSATLAVVRKKKLNVFRLHWQVHVYVQVPQAICDMIKMYVDSFLMKSEGASLFPKHVSVSNKTLRSKRTLAVNILESTA